MPVLWRESELPQFQSPVLISTELVHSQLHFYGPNTNQRERTAAESRRACTAREILLVMGTPPPTPGSPFSNGWVTLLIVGVAVAGLI